MDLAFSPSANPCKELAWWEHEASKRKTSKPHAFIAQAPDPSDCKKSWGLDLLGKGFAWWTHGACFSPSWRLHAQSGFPKKLETTTAGRGGLAW